MMNFLIEMKGAPSGEVWLHSISFSKEWTCSFKGKVNDLTVDITNRASTPEEAVEKTYASFYNLSTRVRDITSPLLEAPSRPAKPEFETPNPDDDIPF